MGFGISRFDVQKRLDAVCSWTPKYPMIMALSQKAQGAWAVVVGTFQATSLDNVGT